MQYRRGFQGSSPAPGGQQQHTALAASDPPPATVTAACCQTPVFSKNTQNRQQKTYVAAAHPVFASVHWHEFYVFHNGRVEWWRWYTKNENIMKKQSLAPLLLLLIALSGCELIGDIFQAGMAVGIIMVVVVIGLILFVLRKIF